MSNQTTPRKSRSLYPTTSVGIRPDLREEMKMIMTSRKINMTTAINEAIELCINSH